VKGGALLLAASLSLLAAACASSPAKPSPGQGTESYRFDLGFAPAPDRDRVLAGTVTATDLATRRSITTPRFEVAWGASQALTAEDPGTLARLDVVVRVDEGGYELSYDASVRKGGRVVASRKASVPVRN